MPIDANGTKPNYNNVFESVEVRWWSIPLVDDGGRLTKSQILGWWIKLVELVWSERKEKVQEFWE